MSSEMLEAKLAAAEAASTQANALLKVQVGTNRRLAERVDAAEAALSAMSLPECKCGDCGEPWCREACHKESKDNNCKAPDAPWPFVYKDWIERLYRVRQGLNYKHHNEKKNLEAALSEARAALEQIRDREGMPWPQYQEKWGIGKRSVSPTSAAIARAALSLPASETQKGPGAHRRDDDAAGAGL